MTWGKLSVTVSSETGQTTSYISGTAYFSLCTSASHLSRTIWDPGNQRDGGGNSVFYGLSLGLEPKGRERPGAFQYPPSKVAFLARNPLQEQSLPLSYIKHRQCFMST